jgi:hypothetical protein
MNANKAAWQLPRHIHYEKHLRAVAAAWFASKGYPVSRKIKYILVNRDDWHQNIILPEVAEVKVEPHPCLASARYRHFQGKG